MYKTLLERDKLLELFQEFFLILQSFLKTSTADMLKHRFVKMFSFENAE